MSTWELSLERRLILCSQCDKSFFLNNSIATVPFEFTPGTNPTFVHSVPRCLCKTPLTHLCSTGVGHLLLQTPWMFTWEFTLERNVICIHSVISHFSWTICCYTVPSSSHRGVTLHLFTVSQDICAKHPLAKSFKSSPKVTSSFLKRTSLFILFQSAVW